MSKILSVTGFLMMPFFAGYGQQYRNSVVDNGMIYSLNNRVPTTVGSVYLNEEWKEARLTLKKNEGKFLEVP